jgi:hypothetical protein
MEASDDLNDSFYIVNGGFGQNAMPEIHDMAWPCACPTEQIGHLRTKIGQRAKQRRRIEVTLDRSTITDVHPCLIDIDPPIDPHHITARGVQFAKESASTRSEVNYRHPGPANSLDQRS